jgi:hypothetical protein
MYMYIAVKCEGPKEAMAKARAENMRKCSLTMSLKAVSLAVSESYTMTKEAMRVKMEVSLHVLDDVSPRSPHERRHQSQSGVRQAYIHTYIHAYILICP